MIPTRVFATRPGARCGSFEVNGDAQVQCTTRLSLTRGDQPTSSCTPTIPVRAGTTHGGHEPAATAIRPMCDSVRYAMVEFMGSGLFLLDLLSGHEPESAGKPAHSIRFARSGWASELAKRVECGGSPPLFVLGSWREGRRLGGSLALPDSG